MSSSLYGKGPSSGLSKSQASEEGLSIGGWFERGRSPRKEEAEMGKSRIRWNPVETPAEGEYAKVIAVGSRSLVPTTGTLKRTWQLPERSQGCRWWGAGELSSASCLPDCQLLLCKPSRLCRYKSLQKRKGQGHMLEEGPCWHELTITVVAEIGVTRRPCRCPGWGTAHNGRGP